MTTAPASPSSRRGFTLIELLIVIAVVGVIAALAAPSFSDYIRMQRLKGTQAELISNLQFARSEAISRNEFIYINFGQDADETCYSIFTTKLVSNMCNCTLGAGKACPGDPKLVQEVRTVSVPKSLGVQISIPTTPPSQMQRFAYDNITGGIMRIPNDMMPTPYNEYIIETAIDSSRTLRTVISSAGRPTVCAPSSTSVGAPPCP